MTEQSVVPFKPQAPAPVRDYNAAQLDLIRRTVAKDTTADEFDMFVQVCRRVGLDPFRKQIYCLVYNKDNEQRRSVSFITSIDGLRSIASRSGRYRPDQGEPEYTYRDDLKDPATNPLGLEKAVVTVWQMDDAGGWHPIKGVAYWDEFAPLQDEWEGPRGQRQKTGRKTLTGKWPQMPRLMLAKCAEAQALRKGWPEDLSGLHAPEEMDQAWAESNASAIADQAAEEARMARIAHARDSIPIMIDQNEGLIYMETGKIADAILAVAEKADAEHLQWLIATNREGLKQFWAKEPTDALELKKRLEHLQETAAAKPAPKATPAAAQDPPPPSSNHPAAGPPPSQDGLGAKIMANLMENSRGATTLASLDEWLGLDSQQRAIAHMSPLERKNWDAHIGLLRDELGEGDQRPEPPLPTWPSQPAASAKKAN